LHELSGSVREAAREFPEKSARREREAPRRLFYCHACRAPDRFPPLTRENVDIVRRWFERWNAGERDTFDEEMHPEAEIVSVMLGGAHRGPDGLRRWFGEIEDQFDEWVVFTDEIRSAGDRVAAIGKVRLRGRGSGVSFEAPVGWLFEIRDGKLARLQTFVEDPREALAQM
jgi:ketosteroid isomerase-like protein